MLSGARAPLFLLLLSGTAAIPATSRLAVERGLLSQMDMMMSRLIPCSILLANLRRGTFSWSRGTCSSHHSVGAVFVITWC